MVRRPSANVGDYGPLMRSVNPVDTVNVATAYEWIDDENQSVCRVADECEIDRPKSVGCCRQAAGERRNV
jgi:hypothetical protein